MQKGAVMQPGQKHFRKTFLTPEIDKALAARAEAEGVRKGDLVIEYLEEELGLSPIPPPRSASEFPRFDPTSDSTKFRRNFSLPESLAGMVASRASAEGITGAMLIARVCAEGLSRPRRGDGTYALKAKQRLVAFHREKIDELASLASDSRRDLETAVAEFRNVCPHLNAAEASTCSDCGAIVTRAK